MYMKVQASVYSLSLISALPFMLLLTWAWQVADLYGIRTNLVDGGEIRGAGNAWICPEVFFVQDNACLKDELNCMMMLLV